MHKLLCCFRGNKKPLLIGEEVTKNRCALLISSRTGVRAGFSTCHCSNAGTTGCRGVLGPVPQPLSMSPLISTDADRLIYRSEEHTSELQSQSNLVCRLLLEKKKHIRSSG